MGYYTDYTLEVKHFQKRSTPIPEELVNVLTGVSEDGFTDLGFSQIDDNNYYCYDKWYEWEEDMREISKDFPDFLFTLHGDGERSDDFWVAYFLCGKMQHSKAKIVYDEFKKGALC